MKKKCSLILDKEFLDYCKLNNIEDVEKLAIQVFNRGFAILKYGETPQLVTTPKPTETPRLITVPKPVEVKKTQVRDIYDE